MTAIAYDLPLLNLISQLDATGHVTHTQHRKTHVTLHHNGGRLSHYGVLDVWRIRPASAHFNIDALGTAAQFVRVNEYAWATGSTVGNQRSISIEMCNLSLAPEWLVSGTTWQAAGRLAGWLFARVIGYRPTREFLVQHKSWNATLCAGPYIDKVYNNILAVAQETYDNIVRGVVKKELDMGAQLVRGSDDPAVFLVEVTGNGGVSKTRVKGQGLIASFEAVMGQSVRTVDQWKLNWFVENGSVGE